MIALTKTVSRISLVACIMHRSDPRANVRSAPQLAKKTQLLSVTLKARILEIIRISQTQGHMRRKTHPEVCEGDAGGHKRSEPRLQRQPPGILEAQTPHGDNEENVQCECDCKVHDGGRDR